MKEYFEDTYYDLNKSNVTKTGYDSYFKKLKGCKGNPHAGIELWLEKWKDRWCYSLAVFCPEKTFKENFPNYEDSEYYKEKCWDCNKDDVKEPNSNEFTFQYCENTYYLSLYIKDGYERETIEKFFSNEYVKRICPISDNKITERLQQSWARVGQGKYRDDMLKLWNNACSVTECSIKESLVASHAKPWRDSEPKEKTDAHNGLLLASHLDSLFDKFLITFDENWKIKIAPGLESECEKMGITSKMMVKYEKLNEQDQKEVQNFLKIHRERFKKRNRRKGS